VKNKLSNVGYFECFWTHLVVFRYLLIYLYCYD